MLSSLRGMTQLEPNFQNAILWPLEWITPAAKFRSQDSNLDEVLADVADNLCAQGC